MFCQGHTVRWALAWTFSLKMLQDFLPATHKKIKPITWNLEPKYKYKGCVDAIPKLLTDLKVSDSFSLSSISSARLSNNPQITF